MTTDEEVLYAGDNRWEDIGVTLRQLDHWTTRGYLQANIASPGTGRSRTWSVAEFGVATRMKTLIGYGFEPSAAAIYARQQQIPAPLIDGTWCHP